MTHKMSSTELLAVIEKIAEKAPKLCTLMQTSTSFLSPSAVRDAVLKFDATEGWLCFQSDVRYFQNKEIEYTQDDVLLYGELAKSGASLHIREDGKGAWILTQLTDQAGGDYLMEEKSFLGEKGHAPNKLYYRVYWENQKGQGFHRIAARFIGFQSLEKEK
jgi:hypothetical protein